MKITDYPSVNELRDTDLLYIDGERGPKKIRYKEFKDNVILPFELGIDANGNYGYKKVGADTVTPFKSVSGTYNTDTPGIHDVKEYEFARVTTRDPVITVTLGENLNIDPVSYHYVHSYWDSSIDDHVTKEHDLYCFLTKQKYDFLFLHVSDTQALYASDEDKSWDEGYDNQPIFVYGSIFENNIYKGPDHDNGYVDHVRVPEFTTIDRDGHIKTAAFKNVPANSSIIYMSSGLSPCSKSTLNKSFGVTFT